MLEELRHRIAAYLTSHQICVLNIADIRSTGDDLAMPVRYRLSTAADGHELELECLIPRWADIAYYLEQEHAVLIIVLACYTAGLRWLQYRGTARPVVAPNWSVWLPRWMSTAPPDELYLVIRITPERITLFDEERGWGAREALESGSVWDLPPAKHNRR